ncbi:MAG: lytic transglycosylase domain-containing protein [Deltaproteobacteria bacterium]|nr:lytic transglycosylase domain-containing protein [Deltaproteobacteria bacterium]MBW1958414.1 lytic transglycosylase domain-containing protein [Deltaproteobacteria bacterium]MBW2012363.1 lytic transglycosylase domain-containing protein [Deltaproteobacteria bacterium]MBW2088731.1 lytic transglycosylase domain-containing protein [Deltaproteobacteria bacterium]MBW2319568.1 lytic transglycosylase domain-containing protein [Deltaproteobacteria bacterium]
MIKLFILIFSSVFVVYTFTAPVYADIYVYIDSGGVLHFTNAPTSSNYKIYIREKPSRSLNSGITDRYDDLITEASKKYGVSFSLLKALIKIESDFNPRAISTAGAKGLMQIMPKNIRALNIKDPFDPLENIMGGARYLKQLIKRFDGELPMALAAYNAGPNMVDRYKRIPPFEETENFVEKVMKYYSIFKKG